MGSNLRVSNEFRATNNLGTITEQKETKKQSRIHYSRGAKVERCSQESESHLGLVD